MKTLIPYLEELLSSKTNIGIIVIDEDHRAITDPYEGDAHVTKCQVSLLKFALARNLSIWFVDTNRSELLDVVNHYAELSWIRKGDANAFGDGYSHYKPEFADTGLHGQLQNKGITHLVIMGFHVHCCVQATVGARTSVDTFGKGAIHFGYQVLTSGDILRSSGSHPALERCNWKDVDSVTYFETVQPSISLNDFRTAYQQYYDSQFFKNPMSKMKRMLDSNSIKSIEDVVEHIENDPTSRSAVVYESLRPSVQF